MKTIKRLSGFGSRLRVGLLAAVMFVAGFAHGAAELKTYATPGYVFGVGGVSNNVLRTDRPFVTKTDQLVFPGATLAEIRNHTFCGYMSGSCATWSARSYFTHEYTVAGELKALLVTIQRLDNNGPNNSYIKGTTIKLTQRDDGVWAKCVECPYFTTTDASLEATKDFARFDGNGNVVFQNCTGTGGNYNIQAFAALAVVPTTERALVFANPPDGTTLTVNDIRDYAFTGISISQAIGRSPVRHPMQNKCVTCDANGVATSIRLELQVMDDKYLKCAVVELTNGEDGVYG